MFKKTATPAKLAERQLKQRFSKAAARHQRIQRAQRASFIVEIAKTQPTDASRQEAERLVQRVRDAKQAPFLKQYRIAR